MKLPNYFHCRQIRYCIVCLVMLGCIKNTFLSFFTNVLMSVRLRCVHLYQEQPLAPLAIAAVESLFGPLQPGATVLQAAQGLQGLVAPHHIQLQHGKVVYGRQQLRAALAKHTQTSQS